MIKLVSIVEGSNSRKA